MRALITGAGGQLGKALKAACPDGTTLTALSSAQLDIRDADAVAAAVRAASPDYVVNAAAFTKVDLAETQEELADAVNRQGVANLARAAAAVGARLVHISTDFVFDGKASVPYRPPDAPAPLSAYGRTKRAGEDAAGPDGLIIRTGWVYSLDGQNFLTTMLRLMRERDSLRVVDDQIGTPTSAGTLANTVWALAMQGRRGIWHVSDSGVASWYDFAVAIMEEAVAAGILPCAISVDPIPSSDYPTPARRPAFSVLDKHDTIAALGRSAPHWRVALRETLEAARPDE